MQVRGHFSHHTILKIIKSLLLFTVKVRSNGRKVFNKNINDKNITLPAQDLEAICMITKPEARHLKKSDLKSYLK